MTHCHCYIPHKSFSAACFTMRMAETITLTVGTCPRHEIVFSFTPNCKARVIANQFLCKNGTFYNQADVLQISSAKSFRVSCRFCFNKSLKGREKTANFSVIDQLIDSPKPICLARVCWLVMLRILSSENRLQDRNN